MLSESTYEYTDIVIDRLLLSANSKIENNNFFYTDFLFF